MWSAREIWRSRESLGTFEGEWCVAGGFDEPSRSVLVVLECAAPRPLVRLVMVAFLYTSFFVLLMISTVFLSQNARSMTRPPSSTLLGGWGGIGKAERTAAPRKIGSNNHQQPSFEGGRDFGEGEEGRGRDGWRRRGGRPSAEFTSFHGVGSVGNGKSEREAD
ncbi:hypothetical protein DFJ73DRAFT_831510 [Zopfochytrium polystomum]|nr:hypothetical protein DFJ73DRAFT_831510 [Zopfochytrium polystomum]